MSISSPGIGSGLDVNSIITQLLSIEKQPLQKLQTQASTIQSQISLVGKIQSQVSSLQGKLAKLAGKLDWEVRTTTSSNEAAVLVKSATGAAQATYNITVSNLAKAATGASTKVNVDEVFGGGTLQIAANGGAAINVAIAPGSTLSQIASAINNSSNIGVNASVVRDGLGQEQLVLKSKTTGSAGFSVAVTGDTDGNNADPNGLSRLVMTQAGQNASVTIDGIAISSASNTLSDTLPGLTLELKQVATDVSVTVLSDTSAIKSNLDAFVTAYNELNTTLRDALKYDEATKTRGTFQGDGTLIGLQNALRGMLGSATAGGVFNRLSDVGVEMKKGGALEVNTSKMDAALAKLDDLKTLFTADTGNPLTEGIGRKLNTFTKGLLDLGGTIANKNDTLKSAETRNAKEQDRVTDRLTIVEKRLRAQYSALDAKVGSMQSLGQYVAQQVTAWGKSS